jgi:predicted alpha/beta-fold hydrolase
MKSETILENPDLFAVLTARGGHVAFLENDRIDIDRSWAENRAIDFFQILDRFLV